MTRTAWITLRHQPPYRSDAFADGFEALGFKVRMAFPPANTVKPDDVVVTWNLNPRYRDAAKEANKAGAALIVAENGYIPRRSDTEPFYALARDGHNGSGFWFIGEEDRWTPLGRGLHEWRHNPKGHVLVCDQRGIGSELMRCPRPFYEPLVPKLKRIFARIDKKNVPEFRLRAHPGRHDSKRTLAQDLEGARAMVTWASNAANEALLMGYPAFRCAPFHVNEAVLSDLTLMPDPPHPDRLAAFKKLAWAQWALSEITNGTAFRCLLQDVL
jgi:hypothetical protein